MDLEQYLPKHLLEPDELSSEAAKTWYEETSRGLDELVCPRIVRTAQILDLNFVEWRGEGKDIITADGQRFFDCQGAGGVFGLGFAHPALVEAVTRQAQRGGLATRTGFVPGQAELARKLVELTPESLRYVAFGNSGTEAVEMAIKLARLTTRKSKLIGTTYGYHGMSIGTISLSGLSAWRDGVEPYLGGVALVEHGDIASLESEIDEDTAAVILEPIPWAAGCPVAAPDYFEKVSQLCKKHDALLIFDEIQTGLGRTGYAFALEHWGVEPDILCVGKILSGGMVPISAIVHNHRVHRAERERTLFNNSSYAGNPLACAAGITTLNLLRTKYLEQARELGQLMGRGFELLAQKYNPVICGFQGLGLMRCLQFTYPLHALNFVNRMKTEENILVSGMGHRPEFVRISPPFVAELDDIVHLMEAAERVMDRMLATPAEEMMAEFQQNLEKMQQMLAFSEQEVTA